MCSPNDNKLPLLVVGAGSDTPGTALLRTNSSCLVFVPPLEPLGELLLNGLVVQGAGPSVQVEELAAVERHNEFSQRGHRGRRGLCLAQGLPKGVSRDPGGC